MSTLVGYMGFLEIASKVGDFTEKLNFANFFNFEGDFMESHVSYEFAHKDQYCLERCICFVPILKQIG